MTLTGTVTSEVLTRTTSPSTVSPSATTPWSTTSPSLRGLELELDDDLFVVVVVVVGVAAPPVLLCPVRRPLCARDIGGAHTTARRSSETANIFFITESALL